MASPDYSPRGTGLDTGHCTGLPSKTLKLCKAQYSINLPQTKNQKILKENSIVKIYFEIQESSAAQLFLLPNFLSHQAIRPALDPMRLCF